MGRRVLPLLVLAVCALAADSLEAAETGKYLFDPGGRVQGVRAVDTDADGRPDLVVLVQDPATAAYTVLVLRTPAAPTKRRFFPEDHVTRIACDGDLADAGALAVGRFGRDGAARLRFLGPRGIVSVRPDGTRDAPVPTRTDRPTLFGRSPGRPLVWWDAVADLDGDGLDEMWFPLAGQGATMLLGGTADGDRVVPALASNRAASTEQDLVARFAFVPNLFPADIDGDGKQELLALDGTELQAWFVTAPRTAPGDPDLGGQSVRIALPFLAPDPDLGPEDTRTPRIQVADVDGDGHTDLLVTLITGKRSRLESMRTILFHYPGPFRDEASGQLVSPRARLDTESVVLHPTFVDLDGDGKLDYVGDSMRGNRLEMIARLLGKPPTITFVGFRFDAKTGTFEPAPCFTIQRGYSSDETLSNRFGRSARFDGDFDGDGRADLLDLGDLTGVTVVRGTPERGRGSSDVIAFESEIVPRVPVAEGLAADSLIADLNADGRADAVLWSAKSLFLVVSKGAR